MPNPYQAVLYPKAKLGMIMQELASKHKQGISTYAMKLLLEHFKTEFIAKWSIEEYEEYHKILSMSIKEQKKLKAIKEKEKERKAKDKITMQKKALELKLRELNIREKNLGIRTDTQAQKISDKQEKEETEHMQELKKWLHSSSFEAIEDENGNIFGVKQVSYTHPTVVANFEKFLKSLGMKLKKEVKPKTKKEGEKT